VRLLYHKESADAETVDSAIHFSVCGGGRGGRRGGGGGPPSTPLFVDFCDEASGKKKRPEKEK